MFVFNSISGEELWPGQCRNGQKQSPIDLAKDASVIGRYSPLLFKNYDKLLKNATIRNTGHSCKSIHHLHFISFPITSFLQWKKTFAADPPIITDRIV